MILTIMLVTLLAVSAVSATENVTGDVIGVDDVTGDNTGNSLKTIENSIEIDLTDSSEDDSEDDWEDDWEDDSEDDWEDDWGDDYDDVIRAKLEIVEFPRNYGDNITFKLTNLNDSSALSGMKLSVYTGKIEGTKKHFDQTNLTTDLNGLATFHVPSSYYGFYYLTAGFYVDDGVSIYAKFGNKTVALDDYVVGNFTVPLNLLSFKLTQEGNYYGTAVLKISLVSNQVLANEKVKITFSNGKSATVTTDSKGIATYSMPFGTGTYWASVTVVSCGVSKKLSNIKISKASATLTPTPLSTTYASGKYFQVKVVNSKTKKAMSNVKLTLKVYTGKKYNSVTITTDAKGIAKYSASTLSLGTHKIVVSIKNTKFVSASAKSSSVKVSKATLKISAPKVTNNYKTGTFKVTVKNKESGNAMSGVKVSIKVYTGNKYKTFTVKTNNNGVASISTASLSKAAHNVVVNVAGTSNYKAISSKSSIRIEDLKLKTSFKVNMLMATFKDGNLKSFQVDVDLIDEKGNILSNKVISAQAFGQWTRFGYVYYISDKYTQDVDSAFEFGSNSCFGDTSISLYNTDELGYIYFELSFAGDINYKGCSGKFEPTVYRYYIGSAYWDSSVKV